MGLGSCRGLEKVTVARGGRDSYATNSASNDLVGKLAAGKEPRDPSLSTAQRHSKRRSSNTGGRVVDELKLRFDGMEPEDLCSQLVFMKGDELARVKYRI